MRLDDAQERSAAAGEYVLGTLVGDELAQFEAALAQDSGLRAEIYAWQDRLLGLARLAPPADPDAAVWQRIEQAIGARPAAAAPALRARGPASNDSLWQRVGVLQAFGAVAMAVLVVLAALLVFRPPAAESARYLALLQAPADKSTGWVVEVIAGDRVRLVPVAAAAGTAVPEGKALQFWTKPQGAAGPTSLGLVPAGRITELPVARLPAVGERQLFELTLEPATGSPIGRPTGPILYVGSTVRL